MAVRKRGNRWQADVKDQQGRRVRRSFSTEYDAKQWEQKATQRVSEGREIDIEETCQTIETFYNTYHLMIWENHNRTVESAYRSLTSYLDPTISLHLLSSKTVLSAVASMRADGLSNSTINTRLSCLSKLLKYAQKMEVIDTLPLIERLPIGASNPRFLTREQETSIREWFVHRGLEHEWHYLRFLLYTGARFSEPKAVTRRDIGERTVTFPRTKSGIRRTVPLTQQSNESLNFFLQNWSNNHVFEVIKYRTIKQHWDVMRRDVGHGSDKAYTIHILRHTCASRLVQAGVDLRRVKEWMGHSSINTTLIYANLAPNDLDQAASKLENF